MNYAISKVALKGQLREAARDVLGKPFDKRLTASELDRVIAHVVRKKVVAPQMNRSHDLCSTEKTTVYFSIEFLVGRTVLDALNNIGILDMMTQVCKEEGLDIHILEEVRDPALGNGGLGRLAACFIESAATHGYPLYGAGLYYRYGLFKQAFNDKGEQVELPDDWAPEGSPWFTPDYRYVCEVPFKDDVIRAVPMVMDQIGYNGSRKTFNGNAFPLILWKAEPIEGVTKTSAAQISDWLYPSDGDDEGKKLRIRQEYFFVSAHLQMLFKIHKEKHGNLNNIEDYYVFQMNDTHPVFAVLEFIRLLQSEGFTFDEAFEKARKCFAYTNHTVMSEALEKWDIRLFKPILPDIYKVIENINYKLVRWLEKKERFCQYEWENGARKLKPNYDLIREYEMIDTSNGLIHMANIACYMAFSINGVAEVHTEILKNKVLKKWYELYPARFTNVTNGVTPRRWLDLANPDLSQYLTKWLGTREWITDLTLLEGLEAYKNDNKALAEFAEVKHAAKVRLAKHILEVEGVEIDPNSIFDIQVKRIHMYKRQNMNVLRILYIYDMLKQGKLPDFYPTTFIIGGKAAASYMLAKQVIKSVKDIQNMVNNDPDVNQKMRVVFLTDFSVSYGGYVYPAADISAQISQAGTEASGTGNMKFMMNGAVTLGTEDGANIEIFNEASPKNNYKFGATVEEFDRMKPHYRHEKTREATREIMQRPFEYLKQIIPGLQYSHWDVANAAEDYDQYFSLYDVASYIDVTLRANRDYADEKRTGDFRKFTRKQFKNVAHSYWFSSDRTIAQYAERIWHIKKIVA